MGDNVNLASRLEGINKQYGTNIVISQYTHELIKNDSFFMRELDSVQVKGKKEPVTIYELIDYDIPSSRIQEALEKFEKGLDAYKRKQWKEAITLFQETLQVKADDRPAEHYIE
jgi:adenylate cyclase